MATARRTRTIAAPPQAVWELICDPYHLPRWWPGVERVEAVASDRFTEVLSAGRGRPVRADFRVVEARPLRLAVWEQEVAGTPFARVLRASVIRLSLQPAGEATAVAIAHEHRLRGYSRTGGLMLRRATGTRLGEALDGLERMF